MRRFGRVTAVAGILALCGGSVLVAAPVGAVGSVRYVDAAASGAVNGSSWADARTDPQDATSASAPVATPAVPLTGVTDIEAGNEWHSCAVTDAGGVLCWGFNNAGQLGDGTNADRSTATPVVGLGASVVRVVAGGGHTCALTTAGGVKCWGYGSYGQLGNGTTGFFNPSPTNVVGLTSGVAAIAAGENQTCAVLVAGGARCWGANYYGQLGDGTTTARSSPVNVTGLTSGVADVAVGFDHSCAVTVAGAVLCWGYNAVGQLGNGTTANRSTPGAVTGLSSGGATLSLGWFHTCAVMTGGNAKCWGSNGYGQLGDGTFTDHTTPVDVTGLPAGISAITAGYWHTCATTVAGAAVCWGDNEYGELGDGTTTHRTAPVAVVGLGSGVSDISGGFVHTCALVDGAAKCWGLNQYSQLGDGTTTERWTPVNVLDGTPQPAITPGGFVANPEGNTGSVIYDLPVRLSNPLTVPVTVDWATVDTSANPRVAQAGSDFVAGSGTVTFDPGETVQTVQIEVLGDTVDEPPLLYGEWGLVRFFNPTNAVLDTATFFGHGLFVIIDDEPDLPVLTPGGVVVNPEGDDGSTFWDLPVRLSHPSDVPVTIDWATVDTSANPGVAQAGTDFVAASGTLTFPPGSTVQNISLEILGDAVDEAPLLYGEWGLVSFSNPTSATLDTATFFGHGLFLIMDDDP